MTTAEAAVAARNTALDEARKRLASPTAGKTADAPRKSVPAGEAKPAEGPAGDEPPEAKPAETEATLTAAVSHAQAAAMLAAEEMLAAAANLTAVEAKIAADNAAFAMPPAENAKQLAVAAGRAERVSNLAQARLNVMRLERELAEAKAGADDAAKKKAAETETKLVEATKAREAAQPRSARPVIATHTSGKCTQAPAAAAAPVSPAGSPRRPIRSPPAWP